MKVQNVKVFYRVLPQKEMCWEYVKVLDDLKTFYVRCRQDLLVGKEDCIPNYWTFLTDGIFYNNTQQEIYDAAVISDGLLEQVCRGTDATILGFGQSGTGKSLTINGLHNAYQDRGIAPRLITGLFNMKNMVGKMCIQMSYIETHKNHIVDLLNGAQLDIFTLRNVSLVKVKTEYEALALLFKGEGFRKVQNCGYPANTANAVLTFKITSISTRGGYSERIESKIHLVDLAGCDAYGNLTSFCKSVDDVGNGNLVKTQLEQFVLILQQNKPEQVLAKHRLNIIIHYLRDCLNCHSILRFIGHLRIDKEYLLITLSMLRFGQVVRGIKPKKLQLNGQETVESKYDSLLKQLEDIKRDQKLNVMFTNGANLSTNIDQERMQHMQKAAKDYLQDQIGEIVLMNVTDVNTVLKIFKDMYNKLEAERDDALKMQVEKKLSMGSDGPLTHANKKGPRRTSRRSITSVDRKKINKNSTSNASIHIESVRNQINLPAELLGGAKPKNRQSADSSKRSGRRSRTSSTNMIKRPSQGKGSSRSTLNKQVIGEEEEKKPPVPNELPSYEDAWEMYKTDGSFNYNSLNDAYIQQEECASTIHKQYLSEFKLLQSVMEAFETRQVQLQNAQMQRHVFKREAYDENGDIVITDLEKQCQENLSNAQNDVVDQQEKLLKCQTELKVAMDQCKNLKKDTQDDFEKFCLEMFQTVVPKLEPSLAQSEAVATVERAEDEAIKNLVCKSESYNQLAMFEIYKKDMKNQARRKMWDELRNRKWIKY